MTREHKLALIVGFSLILLVGVLISDHLSRARQAKIASVGTGETNSVALAPPNSGDPMKPLNDALAGEPAPKVDLAATPSAPIGSSGSQVAAKPEGAPAPVIVAQGSGRAPAQEDPESALDRAIRQKGLGSLVDRGNGRYDIYAAQETKSQPDGTIGSNGILTAKSAPTSSGTPGSELTAPKTDPAKSAKTNTTLATNEPQRYHAVKKGETMFQIATDYYGTGRVWRELAKYNGVENKEGAVRVGTKLRIPTKDTLLGKAAPAEGRATVAAPQPAAKPAQGKREVGSPVKPKVELATYTVKKGDTLGDISKKVLGTTKRWQEFVELNKLDDEDHIPAGTILKVPAMRG